LKLAMRGRLIPITLGSVTFLATAIAFARPAGAEGAWEITPASQRALQGGIEWLAKNQGPEGNWQSNDLGLVSMGALAFLSAGHLPGRGRYGQNVQQALDYVVRHAKPSGLLNISVGQHDMYNHGLSTFVLGQAYGMGSDQRLGAALDRALKLIAQTQCRDGGWDYVAQPQPNGHDLSLAVMQAKALRSAVDSGLDVSPEVIEAAIRSVRQHYLPEGCPYNADETEQRKHPGQFTYSRGGGRGSVAMAAAGVVCLQEFAQYDDWRIEKSMEFVAAAVRNMSPGDPKKGPLPQDEQFFPYAIYYIGQALYQVGGNHWQTCYPLLRDYLVKCQLRGPPPEREGMWEARGSINGRPGQMYMTSVACFVLAMPNRYLPILQEGKISTLRKQFQTK
jgi:hypothetical protein